VKGHYPRPLDEPSIKILLSIIYQFVKNVASTDKRIAVISGPVPRTVRPA